MAAGAGGFGLLAGMAAGAAGRVGRSVHGRGQVDETAVLGAEQRVAAAGAGAELGVVAGRAALAFSFVGLVVEGHRRHVGRLRGFPGDEGGERLLGPDQGQVGLAAGDAQVGLGRDLLLRGLGHGFLVERAVAAGTARRTGGGLGIVPGDLQVAGHALAVGRQAQVAHALGVAAGDDPVGGLVAIAAVAGHVLGSPCRDRAPGGVVVDVVAGPALVLGRGLGLRVAEMQALVHGERLPAGGGRGRGVAALAVHVLGAGGQPGLGHGGVAAEAAVVVGVLQRRLAACVLGPLEGQDHPAVLDLVAGLAGFLIEVLVLGQGLGVLVVEEGDRGLVERAVGGQGVDGQDVRPDLGGALRGGQAGPGCQDRHAEPEAAAEEECQKTFRALLHTSFVLCLTRCLQVTAGRMGRRLTPFASGTTVIRQLLWSRFAADG